MLSSESEVEVLEGIGGQTQVCCDGYLYSKKFCSSLSTRWRCIKSGSYGCGGAMSTDSQYPYRNPRKFNRHCHPPNEFLIKVKDIKIKLRQIVEETPEISITQAVNSVLKDVSEEEKANLGDIASIKRYLRHVKKRAKEGKSKNTTPHQKVISKKELCSNTDMDKELLSIEKIHCTPPNETINTVRNSQGASELDIEALEDINKESKDGRNNLDTDNLNHHKGNVTDENALKHLSEFCSTTNKPQVTQTPFQFQTKTQVTQDDVLCEEEQIPNALFQYLLASQPESNEKKAPTWQRPSSSDSSCIMHPSERYGYIIYPFWEGG